MSDLRHSGSRYLYESFDANRARIETQSKLTDEKFNSIDRRLHMIEQGLLRLERRLWVAVYGIVGVLVSSGVLEIITTLSLK